ncbi:MAG TPA: class I SAM-dependent methyltransferase [Flavobacteriaceae bacterium]|nr:class I SAM-dependent methyltransferase [Flavobacteriaceae bacterium]MCB9211936.1 class I SAM-dependent methyltransferase [Alteromonas sp.]HPF09970.1 class I SAM-dependent methyltransferase [Flavobacteriaceae bacterium]HQU20067.1 class I SAM-dependent methyltransferase [Flavobacteriaceae bacterium]HQU63947.1 class I SAM-dependent methyltransferase [Flavobacteriaceae bacterium]
MEHHSDLNKQSETLFLKTKDFLVSGKTFELHWNAEKDILLTSPKPAAEALPLYYQSESYISHTDSKKGLFDKLYQWVKSYSLGKKVRLIHKFNGGYGSVLDVGAGTGEFLKRAQSKGWEIAGIEINELARDISQKKGIPLLSSWEHLPEKQFDVITLWHVIEHLPDLDEALLKISNHLKRNGVLIIAAPNFNSYDAKHYSQFWAAYDVPRHLWHFSKKGIVRLFRREMKLIAVRPMLFDSFYVSLLSEKYKTGRTFSLKALWIGLLSNLSGMRSKEYSSHTYLFKKV